MLPGLGVGGVGWICRSFHGPLIFKMSLWSGQSEVSEKYWPVRERTVTSGYQRLPTVTRFGSPQCRMNILDIHVST